MMSNRLINKIFLAVLAVSLYGCSGNDVQETLGLYKEAPDEFMVLSRPALSVPPEFNLPTPGDTSAIADSNVRNEAEQALFNKNANATSVANSASESALLQKAGADKTNPDIRTLLKQDNEVRLKLEEKSDEKGFFETLIDPIIPESKDPIVDADAERERIYKNKREGKPITEGETPTIETGPETILDQLIE